MRSINCTETTKILRQQTVWRLSLHTPYSQGPLTTTSSSSPSQTTYHNPRTHLSAGAIEVRSNSLRVCRTTHHTPHTTRAENTTTKHTLTRSYSSLLQVLHNTRHCLPIYPQICAVLRLRCLTAARTLQWWNSQLHRVFASKNPFKFRQQSSKCMLLNDLTL